VATGMRTPEQAPSTEEFAAVRAAEGGQAPPEPTDLRVADVEVGGVPCILVRPLESDADRTIVCLHGGGYVWMSARTHLGVVAGLVRASGARCVSVDYRRAPEHPYPAAPHGNGPKSGPREAETGQGQAHTRPQPPLSQKQDRDPSSYFTRK